MQQIIDRALQADAQNNQPAEAEQVAADVNDI